MEPLNEFPHLPEYNQLVKSVENAINRDILPERIYQVGLAAKKILISVFRVPPVLTLLKT